jgi:hypothetical protein
MGRSGLRPYKRESKNETSTEVVRARFDFVVGRY